MYGLHDFVCESNRIEGIHREPSKAEIDAHREILLVPELTVGALEQFVAVVQRGAVLRSREGMNVRVGRHLPPRGGPEIEAMLVRLLERANAGRGDCRESFLVHREYETIHPFMDGNGRSGRAVWLWMRHGNAPLGFLHRWYYQSLDYSDKRT